MSQQNQIPIPEIAEAMMLATFGKLSDVVGSSIAGNAKTIFDALV